MKRYNNFKNNNISKSSGFTLVEIMVAISIFSIVMVVSLGSILSVLDANKKSQTLRSVMDNLNFSLESMTRDIRFGENYHCSTGGTITLPLDCASGNSTLNLKVTDGSQIVYKLVGDGVTSGRIVKTFGGTDYNVTSSDVVIQDLKFRVLGSLAYSNGDLSQPKVIIIIKGYVGSKPTTRSSFILETTVSQRKLDF